MLWETSTLPWKCKSRSFRECLLLFLPELFLHYRIALLFKMMVVKTSKTIALPRVLNGCGKWCPPFVKDIQTRVRKYAKNYISFVTSGFPREIDENCALLGSYSASSGNFLPTFRDNLSVPPSRVHKLTARNCLFSLRNNPEERSTHLQYW
jgi:hypothetical protein